MIKKNIDELDGKMTDTFDDTEQGAIVGDILDMKVILDMEGPLGMKGKTNEESQEN